GLEHVLLIRGACPVLLLRSARDGDEIAARPLEDFARARQVEEIRRGLAHSLRDPPFDQFDLRPRELALLLRALRAQPEFSRPRDVLRKAEAGVVEIARLVAGCRSRAPD